MRLALILVTVLLTACVAGKTYYGSLTVKPSTFLPNSMDCNSYCESYGCRSSTRMRHSKTGICKVYGPGLLDRRKRRQH